MAVKAKENDTVLLKPTVYGAWTQFAVLNDRLTHRQKIDRPIEARSVCKSADRTCE